MHFRRKIKVKVKAEDYAKLMNQFGNLEIDSDGLVTDTIEVEDTKETYAYLVENNVDWEPINDSPQLIPKEVKKTPYPVNLISEKVIVNENIDKEEDIKKLLLTYLGDSILKKEVILGIYNEILRIRKELPSLKFTKDTVLREVLPNVMKNSQPFSNREIAMMALIEEFAKGESKEVVIDSIVDSISKCWNKVNYNTSLIRLMELIYDVKLGNILV